jgi:hypothetical protein
MTKKFSELAIGERFVLNGVEYIKTQEVRVSCCRSINAQLTNDANNKTFVSGNTVVNVNA